MPIDASAVKWDEPAPDINSIQWDTPAVSPTDYQSIIQGGNKQAPAGVMTRFGRSIASFADNTLGGVLPAIAQQVVYPFARVGSTPEAAQATTRRIVGGVEQPFGRAFGVTATPEYQQEGSRQLLNFIGENFQKGAKWIADKTGAPASDIENMLGTMTLAAPAGVKATSNALRTAQEGLAPTIDSIKVGIRAPFEKSAQAAREKASLADYARGPQLDAIADARRLGIALSPVDIQPSAWTRLTTAAAGEAGAQAIAKVNRSNVRKVVLNELDLPPTAQLNGGAAFDAARAKVAAPYEEISKLPSVVADDATRASLEQLRPSEHLIGSDAYSARINNIIDSALDKTSAGLSGAQLLENISTLRSRARKTYNSRTADLAALDVADTNLAVASALERMIDSNITNPKLLGEFQAARQKMAKTYAYEGATDFNTGVTDVSKLARITAKDNAVTGNIAALGRVAGNFPEAFTTKVASPWTKARSVGRTGAMGTLGGMVGYGLGGDYAGAAVGSVLGAIGGKLGERYAANRIASPAYQAGLTLKDARIPVNQLAASMQPPIPQDRALTLWEPEVLGPSGEGGASKLRIIGYGENGVPIYAAEPAMGSASQRTRQSGPFYDRPAPFAQRSITNEIPQQIYRAQKGAELAQEFRAHAERKPAGAGNIIDVDPITGKMTVTGEGSKGVTPNIQVLEDTGKSGVLGSAKMEGRTPTETTRTKYSQTINKKTGMPKVRQVSQTVEQGVSGPQGFNLTATEKIALRQSLLDGMKTEPGSPVLTALSDKNIVGKMQDRQWVSDTVKKLRQQDEMFAAQAARDLDKLRAQDKSFQGFEAQMRLQKKVEAAAAERRSLIDKLESMEETLRSRKNHLATSSVNNLTPSPTRIELNNMASNRK